MNKIMIKPVPEEHRIKRDEEGGYYAQHMLVVNEKVPFLIGLGAYPSSSGKTTQFRALVHQWTSKKCFTKRPQFQTGRLRRSSELALQDAVAKCLDLCPA